MTSLCSACSKYTYSSAYLDCLHSDRIRKEVMNCLQDDVCCRCMIVSCLQHLALPCMPQARCALHWKTQAGIVHTRQEKKHLCVLKRKERPEDEVHWGTLPMCIHQHQRMLLLQPRLIMAHWVTETTSRSCVRIDLPKAWRAKHALYRWLWWGCTAAKDSTWLMMKASWGSSPERKCIRK